MRKVKDKDKREKTPSKAKTAAAAAAAAAAAPDLDVDELVEAAQEAEGQGERYGSVLARRLTLNGERRYGTGEKARRAYEQAAGLYARAAAAAAAAAGGGDADVVYNLGRVYLLLAEFQFPAYATARRRALLVDAQRALAAAARADAANADAAFNLAVAHRAAFELALEGDGDGDGSAVAAAHVEALREADALLDRVLEMQVRQLQEASQQSSDPQCVGDGCMQDHVHHHPDENGASNDDIGGESMDTGGESEAYPDDSEYQIFTQVAATTRETVIDTLVEHAALLTVAARNLYGMDAAQADALYAKAEAKLDASAAFGGAEAAAVGLARAAMVVSRAEALFEAGAKTVSAIDGWQRGFEAASGLYDAVIARNMAPSASCAEAWADKADMLCTWVDCLMTCTIGSSGLPGFDALANAVTAEQQQQQQPHISSSSSSSSVSPTAPTATGLLASVRQMYAEASRAYTSAYKAEPTKWTVLSRLGDLEATRTALYAPTLPAAQQQQASSNAQLCQTLLRNAATYYSRALEALGVSMSLLSSQKPCNDDACASACLFGLAKVLSHLEGREQDVKTALVCWKRRGGSVSTEDMEACGIFFSERIIALDWFAKVVN
ncbi:hypothetical protein HDU83_004297 [Entophlyctis luteolus]|nr:hypothetical protein HDU83_004297 [Entophlyctis luteolus]